MDASDAALAVANLVEGSRSSLMSAFITSASWKHRIKHRLARTARKIPALRHLRSKFSKPIAFQSSDAYWRERYEKGGNSGEGSYGELAAYKAREIQAFAAKEAVRTIFELGCGDGNQLSLMHYPHYVGVDISPNCIEHCRKRFSDKGWQFLLYGDFERSSMPDLELGLSLDVIYHLVEDEIYEAYLALLFSRATRFVLIYASDFDHYDPALPHVRHRAFAEDIALRFPEWRLVEARPNPYEKPHDDPSYGSFAKFHVFERKPG